MGQLTISGDHTHKTKLIESMGDLIHMLPFDVTYTVDELELTFTRPRYCGHVGIRCSLDHNRVYVQWLDRDGVSNIEDVYLDVPAGYMTLASRILKFFCMGDEGKRPIN